MAGLFAVGLPRRCRGLLLTGVPLLAPGGPRPARAWRHRVARRLNRIGLVGDERLERRRRRTGSDDYRAATGVMRDVLVRALAETATAPTGAPLAGLVCPVELVWGAARRAPPVAVAEEPRRLLAEARLTVLPSTSSRPRPPPPCAPRSTRLR